MQNAFGSPKSKDEIMNLSFYEDPPLSPISLESFESYALDRLMEDCTARSLPSDKFDKEIQKVLTDRLTIDKPEEIEKDRISHHFLRYAYCDTEEHRRWFVEQEARLFVYRYNHLSSKNRSIFMKKYGWKTQTLDPSSKLYQEMTRFYTNTPSSVFIVKFEDVPDLVKNRSVIIKRGLCYVSEKESSSIIKGTFKSKLLSYLMNTARNLDKVMNDSRLASFVKNLPNQYIGKDYSNVKVSGNVTKENIPILSKTSFPLCMNYLQTKLHSNHHLKHLGRMQYGLFLKGIGLSLEEALIYWSNEFSNVTADKFAKEYAYNIRHNYGKEGKRADYTPYSCRKIILGTAPGPDEYHGCPFKHLDKYVVKKMLSSLGRKDDEINDIMESVDHGDYQIACKKHWIYSHPGGDDSDVGNHPNGWFEASSKYYKKKDEENGNSNNNNSNKSNVINETK